MGITECFNFEKRGSAYWERGRGRPALPVFAVLFLFSGAEPSTAKLPVFRTLAQSCFHRIVLDVTQGFRKVLGGSNIAIKIIQHPELTISFEDSIRSVRGNGFD